MKKYKNDPIYRQEAFIVDVTEEIWRVMNEKEIRKTDLADKLKCSRAYISQLLNGSHNMTLRTLADICLALKVTPNFSVADDR